LENIIFILFFILHTRNPFSLPQNYLLLLFKKTSIFPIDRELVKAQLPFKQQSTTTSSQTHIPEAPLSQPPSSIPLQETTAYTVNLLSRGADILSFSDSTTQKLIKIKDILLDLSNEADRLEVEVLVETTQLESTRAELDQLTKTGQSRKLIPDPHAQKSTLCIKVHPI